jgi:ABC-type lipoprotein release transport system permease subunit
VLFSQPIAVRDPGGLLAITNQLTTPRGMRGIPMTIAGGRAVASMLYGLKSIDLVRLAAAGVLMSVVAEWAAYVPARRAARLEPLAALPVE